MQRLALGEGVLMSRVLALRFPLSLKLRLGDLKTLNARHQTNFCRPTAYTVFWLTAEFRESPKSFHSLPMVSKIPQPISPQSGICLWPQRHFYIILYDKTKLIQIFALYRNSSLLIYACFKRRQRKIVLIFCLLLARFNPICLKFIKTAH